MTRPHRCGPGVTGLDGIADIGRAVSFSQYDTGSTEVASVWMRVRDYGTVEQARAQHDARVQPAFVPCAQQYDAELAECACRTTEPARPLGEGLNELDPVRWQSLLQTVSQRLDLHAPVS